MFSDLHNICDGWRTGKNGLEIKHIIRFEEAHQDVISFESRGENVAWFKLPPTQTFVPLLPPNKIIATLGHRHKCLIKEDIHYMDITGLTGGTSVSTRICDNTTRTGIIYANSAACNSNNYEKNSGYARELHRFLL